jgi:hypothetical protein
VCKFHLTPIIFAVVTLQTSYKKVHNPVQQRMIINAIEACPKGFNIQTSSSNRRLVPIREGTMHIMIKNLANRSIILCVNPLDTIQRVKQMVQIITNISPDKQRLIFSGHLLDDSRRLQSYNISHQSTIFLVLRLYAKMPKKEVRYNTEVFVHETYSSGEYDRSYKSYST